MKTPALNFFSGKAAKVLFMIAALSVTGISACKKDSSSTGTDTVTEADAVQLTTDAVVPTTGGFAAQTSTSVTLYTTTSATIDCGATKDTTISAASATGLVPSFNYTLAWQYTANCSADNFTFSFQGSSNYAGALMTAADKSSGTYVLTGILPTAGTYSLTSTYERTGTETSKIARQNTFTSDLKITSTNIVVDKTTRLIVSGTGTVSISGKTSGGRSFSFGGTINFLGNKKATVVLNSGVSYPISWS